MNWARKFNSCRKCHTKRYRHKGHGLCTRCEPLVKRIRIIEKQDIEPKRFHDIKINKIKIRLLHFKTREEQLKRDVDCLELESIFEYIAERAGSRMHLFHGSSNIFSWDFSEKQRRALFKILLMIEEDIRWKPSYDALLA